MKQRNKEHSAYGAEAIVEAIMKMLDSGERYVKGSARLSGSSFTFQTEAKKSVTELPVEEEVKAKLDSALETSSTKIVEEESSENKEESPKPKAKKKKKSKS